MSEPDEIEALMRDHRRLQDALRTIATLDPSFKGIKRKYQIAIQTAQIALDMEIRR